MLIEVTLDGTRPLMQHNIRLANPLDPYSQKKKEFTDKKKKTDEDLAAIMWWEARGSAYETSEGFLGLPTDNVWRCLYDAATAFKQGANLKRALLPQSDVEPLIIGGAKVYVDDHLNSGNIDTRAVRNQQSRVMRSRPIIHPPWTVHHRFELLTDIINPRELTPIMERAGRLVGLGEFRPRFGTFVATVTEAE